VAADNSRKLRTEKKSDYYLGFAKAVYDWQKKYLLRPDGVGLFLRAQLAAVIGSHITVGHFV
jgi:hypothetical protein